MELELKSLDTGGDCLPVIAKRVATWRSIRSTMTWIATPGSRARNDKAANGDDVKALWLTDKMDSSLS